MSYDEEGKKTIKERLWGSMEENPYYKKNPLTGTYEEQDPETIARVRAQELAERKAGIDKYFSDNIKDHQITRNIYRMAKEKENENTENTGGRRKRRSHKRKSHKRKSNKRKSNKRKSSRCRGSRRR